MTFFYFDFMDMGTCVLHYPTSTILDPDRTYNTNNKCTKIPIQISVVV